MKFDAVLCRALALATALSSPAWAQGEQLPQLHPQLTDAQQARLREVAAKGVCKPDKTVAASAYALPTGSSGDDSLVDYPYTVTNVGNAWKGGDTFVAPCAGVYSFSISFNTDSFYPCPTEIGTQDDVIVYFVKSTAPLYDDAQVVGDGYGAWRGQISNGPVKRGQASYTVDLLLNAKDAIQTKVRTDGNVFRCLWSANFSAHLVH